jgi:hypothetical protein
VENLSREVKPFAAVSDGATITLPCDRGDRFAVTLAGTGRTVALSGDVDGQRIELVVTQDGTGSRTITTWPATVAWRSGVAPTLRTAAGAVDVIVLVRLASGSYLGYHDAAGGGGGSSVPTVGAATVTVPNGSREWSESVSVAGASATSRVSVWLAPAADGDENDPEMLDLQTLWAVPGSGTVTFGLTFSYPQSGPVKLNYLIGAP